MSSFQSRLESGQTSLADYDDDTMVDKTLKFFISGNIAFNQADNPMQYPIFINPMSVIANITLSL